MKPTGNQSSGGLCPATYFPAIVGGGLLWGVFFCNYSSSSFLLLPGLSDRSSLKCLPLCMMPMQQQQQQQGFPGMVQVQMQPNMQGMMGMNFGGQMPPGAMPMQGGMAMGMQAPGMQFMGQPQFMSMRGPGPQYTADMQKQMAEEHQKRLEQQQRMLEEDRKRRQFEEQKQKLRLLSSVKPKMGASRDDALEAIKGNLDGFSRDAKMHPTPSSHPKKPGPSLEEKLFSSCDLTAEKKAQVSFKSQRTLAPNRATVSAQFHSSTKARNWAEAPGDLISAFTIETPQPEAPALGPTAPSPAADPPPPQTSSDGGEKINHLLTSWCLSRILHAALPFCCSATQPLCLSAALPLSRSAFSSITIAPRHLLMNPFQWTVELLNITFQSLRGESVSQGEAAQSPLFYKTKRIKVYSDSSSTMALNEMMFSGRLQERSLIPSRLLIPGSYLRSSMVYNCSGISPLYVSNQLRQLKGIKVEEMGAALTPGLHYVGNGVPFGTQPQTPLWTEHGVLSVCSAPAILTPVSGSSSSSSDKYAVFKQLSVEEPPEPTQPASDFDGDKYSVFRQLEPPGDRKPVGEGFADFKSVSVDDGFTDFKTADSISPLEPSDQAKMFQPAFPPAFPNSQSLPQLQHQLHQQQQPAVSLSQPTNPLNMADLDLFSMAPTAPTPAEIKPSPFPSVPPSLVLPPGRAKPPGGGAEDFGDFSLFGPTSSSEAAPIGPDVGGGVAASHDDFADFMAFGSSGGEAKGETTTTPQRPQQGSDKYDVFKQLSQEGGLAYDDNKHSAGGSFSSLRSEADDFTDFQSSKFCTALGASEKSLVDKVAAFKQGGKEDSASVKSLDLPSIGGSSVGKEDSEDALSVQLDMKLSDMGGDLKHVMSDSSLDLPGLSAHQPPATEGDDMKFDPFGTSAVSRLASYDWSEREECLSAQGQAKKHLVLDGVGVSSSFPSSDVVHRKETPFGSTENIPITHTCQTKITTFSTDDSVSTDSKFEAFADFGSCEPVGLGGDEDDDFGDFASTVSEKSDSPAAEPGSEVNLNEASDEFGAFHGDKAKFGKSDFLKASSQTKVKSSEEMIKSELATFDLSVQGSHKRSHSLGEKEIGRSPPSPAPEQPFRDRSSTLSEKKPALPVIRDKYKDLTGEVEESERYAYEWQRCLVSALQVITKANNTLNSISSSTVCTEVIQSAQGMEYLLGVVEVYRVTKRVELGIKATAVCSEKLQQLLKDISRVWNNLMGFMSLANLAVRNTTVTRFISLCISGWGNMHEPAALEDWRGEGLGCNRVGHPPCSL
ncbi:unnamed protein product [Oncorhynchus mykiss]|uniref:Synergin gamma C-terminal domain-containing protein n=1 Tax=Oncorhynchus mykiss TaxID=8022 RepID=A0A060W346_ONCMY|nr:unnamed protein product [Oncorhynchus mykiss]